MVKIAVAIDRSYAPVGYLICRLDGQGRWNARDDANTVLVQSDWLYPFWASRFGWQGCVHGSDGTVDCPQCGKTATAFISEAAKFLDHCADGQTIVEMDGDEFAAELNAQRLDGFPSHRLPKNGTP